MSKVDIYLLNRVVTTEKSALRRTIVRAKRLTPIQPFSQALPSQRRTRDDLPLPLPQLSQRQPFRNGRCAQATSNVLLVGHDEDERVFRQLGRGADRVQL